MFNMPQECRGGGCGVYLGLGFPCGSVQFSSVAQSCLTLCDPMDCSTPGFPVHHQLPDPTQTQVHCVGDAIQPSHPLSSPFPLAFNLSQHQGMYGYESWTLKKVEHRRTDAFELWCWRRLLRVPWTARRSNQSVLKEISVEYSLEGLMLKLKLQYFGYLMLGKIEGERKRG